MNHDFSGYCRRPFAYGFLAAFALAAIIVSVMYWDRGMEETSDAVVLTEEQRAAALGATSNETPVTLTGTQRTEAGKTSTVKGGLVLPEDRN
jgi:hypothetical protein